VGLKEVSVVYYAKRRKEG